MLLTRLSRNWFTIHKNVKPIIDVESQTIVDPSAYEDRNLISRFQNWMTNRSCLTDIERSFKDFKRKSMNARFLNSYNKVVDAIEDNNLQLLEEHLSPSLYKTFKKTIRKNEELPYFLVKATECQMVQARTYTESITMSKTANKWFQLTFKYTLVNGDTAHHIVERNDKVKLFRFIKFHL